MKISIQFFQVYVDQDGWDLCDCRACEGFDEPAASSFGFWEIRVNGRVVGQRLTLDDAMAFGQQQLAGPAKADRNAGIWGSRTLGTST